MKEFIHRFLPYIRGHYPRFLMAMAAGILAALCTALITYLIKPVLDDVFIKKDTLMLLFLPLALVGAYVGKSVGTYVQGYLMNYIGQDIVREIRNRLLNHMLLMEMRFFNKMRSGELVARVTGDIEFVRSAVSSYIGDFVRESITIVGLVFVVIYHSPKLAIFGLLVIPMAIIPINIIAKKIKRISRQSMEQNSDITARLNEIFNNAELIKASNSEALEARHFERVNYDFFRISMKITQQNLLVNPLLELLGAVAVALIVYLGGQEVISGKMSAGQFFSFSAALFMIYTPIKRLSSIYAGAQGALAAGNRIFEILDRAPQIVDGAEVLSGNIQKISFENVSLKYDENLALKRVNLAFFRNEIVALKGKSGSGKSSIINLILRLYEPDSGRIFINDQPLKNFTQASLRDKISLVSQRIFIFNDTVAANVAYGGEVDENRVRESLRQAHALDFVEQMEGGIFAKLDEYGANLSGGQRQRIAIARAIYKNAQVLIFDEATSALDEATENAIKRTIEAVKKDKIVLLIAHRPSTIEAADRVIEVRDGEIVGEIRR